MRMNIKTECKNIRKLECTPTQNISFFQVSLVPDAKMKNLKVTILGRWEWIAPADIPLLFPSFSFVCVSWLREGGLLRERRRILVYDYKRDLCWFGRGVGGCADKMPTGQNANQTLSFCPGFLLWLAFCLSNFWLAFCPDHLNMKNVVIWVSVSEALYGQ